FHSRDRITSDQAASKSENRHQATMSTDTEVQNAERAPETGRSEKVRPSSRKKTGKPGRIFIGFLVGGILAVVLMEAILHNFSGKSEDAAGFEERDYREGFAKAHFSADGLRLTGNPQVATAPSVLIIGDSHVEAYSVYDEQTMGS